MSILDLNRKFNVIDNTININYISSNIDNFIENYLYTDTLILVPNYIIQSFWLHDNNYMNTIISIEKHVHIYIILLKENIRKNITRRTFKISNLNDLIYNIINKILYINSILNYYNKYNANIIDICFSKIISLIVNDPIIFNIIENYIIEPDIFSIINNYKYTNYKNNKLYILLKLIKYINTTIFKNNNDVGKFEMDIGKIFQLQISIKNDIQLPKNIKNMLNLYENIKYYNYIKKKFIFLSSKSFIYITKIIIDNLILILNENTLNEIDHILFNTFNDICNMLSDNTFKDINIKSYYKFINEDKLLESLKSNLQESNLNLFNEFLTRKNSIQEIYNILSILISKIDNDNVINIINIIKYITNNSLDLMFNIIDSTKSVIKHKLSKINLTNIMFEKILYVIDDYIKNDNIDEYFKIIHIIHFISNKDMFIDYYYNSLIKRIMQSYINKNKSMEKVINTEKKCYALLKKLFNNRNIYKIYKIIDDIDISYKLNKHYDISVLITSYECWNINQTENIINNNIIDSIKDSRIGMYMIEYNLTFSNNYPNKIINWLLNYGEITITYLNKKINMLPIQFIILEMFEKNDKLLISDILNHDIIKLFTNKNMILKSLINSKLLNIISTQSNLELDNNDLVALNTNDNFECNLIKLINNNINYNIINIDYAYSKNEVLCTVINHYVKKNNINKNDLYTVTKQHITIFDFNIETFNQALDYMIKMDYIKVTNEICEKIFY